MKLSDLSTEKAADVLCEISVYTLSILGDEKLRESLRNGIDKTGAETFAEKYAFAAEKITALLPVFLKTHRNDLFSIIAAVNSISADVVAKQNVMVTLNQFKEIMRDEEMISFFRSCARENGK
jgi:hypothetical protein